MKENFHLFPGMVSEQKSKMEKKEEDYQCVSYSRCPVTFSWIASLRSYERRFVFYRDVLKRRDQMGNDFK